MGVRERGIKYEIPALKHTQRHRHYDLVSLVDVVVGPDRDTGTAVIDDVGPDDGTAAEIGRRVLEGTEW
jgi:hypothetical protein